MGRVKWMYEYDVIINLVNNLIQTTSTQQLQNTCGSMTPHGLILLYYMHIALIFKLRVEQIKHNATRHNSCAMRLTPPKRGNNFTSIISNLFYKLVTWVLLWGCLQMSASESHWWWVNIGSDNGLVASADKPLPEPILTQIYIDIWRHLPTTLWHYQMETFSALLAILRGIHRSPVNFPHKGQWRRVLMFSLIYAWIKCSVNNREAGDLRRHRAHYEAIVMMLNSIAYFLRRVHISCIFTYTGSMELCTTSNR